MAGFVQIIEFTSSRIDEIRKLGDDMRGRQGANFVRRATFTTDRDNPNRHCSIIEFDSFDEAMQNNELPETSEFAQQMAALCDGPPTFRNLDVMDRWE